MCAISDNVILDEGDRNPQPAPSGLDRVLRTVYALGKSEIQRPTVNPDQPPDKHMQEREAEKTADLESLADALAALRQLHRDLDQWERIHLALGLAAVFSGSYGAGAIEAALALTPRSSGARAQGCRQIHFMSGSI
jgi:hypothetical protein